jgi:hypothetical protein
MKSRKAAIARCARAVTGFAIPLLTIPSVTTLLEEAIEAGKTDEELKAIARAYPGIVETKR